MATTTATDPHAEYSDLLAEHHTLRRTRNRTPDQDARLAVVTARVMEIDATPPAGYTVPTAAAQLVEHARAHGWQTLAQWSPPSLDTVFYTVHVGRVLRDGEIPDARGSVWKYKLTWHSRDCPPGRLRLIGRGAETPERPMYHDAPSVRAIRAVITNHPA